MNRHRSLILLLLLGIVSLSFSFSFTQIEAQAEPQRRIQIQPPINGLLPSFDTIADLQRAEQTIPQDVKNKLEKLENALPDCDFKQLTIKQLKVIDAYVTILNSMNNLELLKSIEAYLTAAFNKFHDKHLYDKLDKIRNKLEDDVYVR